MQTENPSEGEGKTVVADGLTKRFGKFTAVENLSFSIGRGEIFGFLGPNGAGKSTAIRMLCGLLLPTSGKASVGGFDVARDPEKVRAGIGYMSQKFSLYKDLTVFENVEFFGGVYGLAENDVRRRFDEVAELTGLAGLADELTGTLSGAMQQRLALGCAILHEPSVLFLDEPTSGIDPLARRIFWDIIRHMSGKSVAILVTTHFLDEAELCDRLGFIMSGRLIAGGRPAEIRERAVAEDLFEAVLPPASGARETIGGIDGVREVSYFGQNLHVFCRKGFMNEKDLEHAIRARGLKPSGVRRVKPRLEDAFIRLAEGDVKEKMAWSG